MDDFHRPMGSPRTTKQAGDAAEDLALGYLRGQGLRLHARNYRTPGRGGGEIDLIMPITEGALFDGRPAGWMVTPAGSAHSPTVTQGRALVLYLLPAGAITFTK